MGGRSRVLLFDLGASVGFRECPAASTRDARAGRGSRAVATAAVPRLRGPLPEPDAVFGRGACTARRTGAVGRRDWWASPPTSARVRFYHDMVDEGQLPATDHPANSFLGVPERPRCPSSLSRSTSTPWALTHNRRGPGRRPELAALVDWLFFEYHFHFDGMNFGWNEPGPGAVNYGSQVPTSTRRSASCTGCGPPSGLISGSDINSDANAAFDAAVAATTQAVASN